MGHDAVHTEELGKCELHAKALESGCLITFKAKSVRLRRLPIEEVFPILQG